MEIVLPQIIFQIVNFSIVLGVLSYLLYRPITQIFQERAERIEKGQQAAQEAIEQQALMSQLEEKKRLDLEKQIAKLLEKASAEAEEHKAKLMERAKLDAADFQQKQRVKWDQERAQLVVEQKRAMIEAVILATEKVIAKKLTKEDKTSLVSQQIDQVLATLA